MNVNNAVIEKVERMDRQRNRSLTWFLVTFLFWSFCSVVLMFGFVIVGGFSNLLMRWIVAPFMIIPFCLWVFFLGWFLMIQGRIKSDPQLARALNDEMVRFAWFRAAAAGFWSMLAVEVLFTLMHIGSMVLLQLGFINYQAFMLPDVRAPLVIAIGVGVTIGSYLYHRRD